MNKKKREISKCDSCGKDYYGGALPYNNTEEPIYVCKKCNNPLTDKYVIIDLRNMDFMKDENGKIEYYHTKKDALLTCGMYEFENAWVMKLIYNYIDEK